MPFKLGAYVISATIVGMAGAMNAYFLGFISPISAFDRSINIAIPLMAFLGGIGTLSGPLLGALIEVPLQQYLTIQFGEQGWDLILYGVLFLIIILVLPGGIISTLTRHRSLQMSFRSEKNTLEILPTAPNDISIALSQFSSSPVPQETSVQVVSNLMQQPYRVPSPIPHHRSVQITSKELTQKVRVTRLMTVPQAESLPKPAAKTNPHIGKPCPRCNEPLMTWGDAQFCTRCSFVFPNSKSPIQSNYNS